MRGGHRVLIVVLVLAWAPAVICIDQARSASSAGDGGTAVGAGEPWGCASSPGRVVSVGARGGGAVALTFDDGPSLTQTPRILDTLERLHARATFFEEGRHVRGREALMNRILLDGDEIGNHSFHHPHDPGPGELAATDRAIHRATGFEPCLFRPPYGLLNAKVLAAARRNRLEVVLWTLDSGDEHHPGAAAIRARVEAKAHPGSIVLLHDGGHHPQTVRALPGIVRNLEARGLRLVTVSTLLGERVRRSAQRVPASP